MKFHGSTVVNEDGSPKILYHSTFGDFSEFSVTRDLGFHFGSAFIANKRLEEASKKAGRRGDARLAGANVMPVVLNLKNPLHLDTDPGAWYPSGLYSLLQDHLTAEQISAIRQLELAGFAKAREEGHEDSMPRRKWEQIMYRNQRGTYDAIRDALESNGYDGIVYPNAYEGEGKSHKAREGDPRNLSYVAFRANQIKSAIGSDRNFDRLSESLTDPVASETPAPRRRNRP